MLAGLSYPPIPLFEVGPFALSMHGLFAAFGFIIGVWLALREVRRRGFSVEKMGSALTWALVGAILGARLFTVPAQWITDPTYGFSDVIALAGDYSILGGYAGGIIAGLIRARMVKLPMLPSLDMVSAGLAIGAVVGRIGDLIIVEHLGTSTSFFLGYTLRPGRDISPQHDALEALCDAGECLTYHHTALYDLLGSLALLGVILALQKFWTGRRYGQIFAVWAMWYGLQRFLIDFTRLDAAKAAEALEEGTLTPLEAARIGDVADSVIGPFTGSQWGALAAALFGLGLFIYWGRTKKVVSTEHDVEYGAVVEGFAARPDSDVDTDDGDPGDGALSDAGTVAAAEAGESDDEGDAAGP